MEMKMKMMMKMRGKVIVRTPNPAMPSPIKKKTQRKLSEMRKRKMERPFYEDPKSLKWSLLEEEMESVNEGGGLY